MQNSESFVHRISRRRALQATVGVAAAALPYGAITWASAPEPINSRMFGDITPVHDPCIIRDEDTYYVFCTTTKGDGKSQIPCRTSKDLLNWEFAGFVLAEMPPWAHAKIPDARGIWAPDISFVNGMYYLYYAVSSFGSNRSCIGLATNRSLNPRSPTYKWVDHGLVFESFAKDDYNCIDPAHIADAEGNQWLAFGSFWGGIKMLQLDPETGKPSPGDVRLYSLAARPTPEGGLDTIEAPFLYYRDGWYYLFASYDYCCKGVNSTYYTALGRSKTITGPYLDKLGRRMIEGYGSVILKADQEEKGQWRGPGHCAILHDTNQDYIVYHAYFKPQGFPQLSDADKKRAGAPYLRVAPLAWDVDGWPTAIT